MIAEVIDINEHARELWEAYLEAKERAEHTRDFQDARRAGKLWGRFLDFYSRDKEDRGAVIDFVRHNLRRKGQ